MITTSFAAAALSVLLTGEMAALTPTWQTDYSKVMAAAVSQQKPVAVFIGCGDSGYAKLVTDGQIPADAAQVLSQNFVCMYVDTDTAAGKSLAGDFGLSSGLIISNRGGTYQALRHNGSVTPTALTGYLSQYGDAGKVSTTVEAGTATTVAPGMVIGGGCPNGRCGTPVSGTYVPYGFSPYPAVGGCANGRCPNVR